MNTTACRAVSRLGIAILVGFFMAACATMPAVQPPPTAQAPPPIAQQIAELRTRLLIHVQEERQRLDATASPLVLDAQLANAAQAHCDVMAEMRAFDPNNPDGNVAVNALLADPKFHGLVGENVAAQYFTPSAGIDPDVYARAFLDTWLNSPAHKSNLVYPRFDRIGIGISVAGDEIYVSQVFATDFGDKSDNSDPGSTGTPSAGADKPATVP